MNKLALPDMRFADGSWRQTIKREGDHIVSTITQDPAERRAVMEAVQELRNANGAKELSFGSHVACIPYEDYQNAIKADPGLVSKDSALRERSWARFLHDFKNAQYLTGAST